jgi:hypothetical protein
MKKVWIVIFVYHGLIQEPEIFFSYQKAKKKKDSLLTKSNPAYDEVELFEKIISG